MSHGSDSNEKLNFDLNLVPFIDLLSVLIIFLLLTAVWVNIGAINVKQALGSEGSTDQKNPPSLWVTFEPSGDVKIELKDLEASKSPKEIRVVNIGSRVDVESLEEMTVSLKQQNPEINTALLMPTQSTKYQDMIAVMDKLRKVEIRDLGVAPL